MTPYLDVGLVLDPIQVLMKPIQQEAHQLLTIMLLVAGKLGGELSDHPLEVRGHHRDEVPTPHVLQELGVDLG